MASPTLIDILTAAGQVASGVGALSLLGITWWSQRTSSTALKAATDLAESNENLVTATTNRADLSVKPVLEAADVSPDGRELTLHNGGLGPLCDIHVTLGGEARELVLDAESDPLTTILRPGERATVSLPVRDRGSPDEELIIEGATLLGQRLQCRISREAVERTAPVTLGLDQV